MHGQNHIKFILNYMQEQVISPDLLTVTSTPLVICSFYLLVCVSNCSLVLDVFFHMSVEPEHYN